MKQKVLFLGCGTMGAIIADAFSRAERPCELMFYAPSGKSNRALAEKYSGICIEKLQDTPRHLDIIVFAFKPQKLQQVFQELPHDIQCDLIFSVLAGTSIERIQELFACQAVFRLMPNMPSAVGAGMNLYVAKNVSKAQLRFVRDCLDPLGEIADVKNQDELDLFTLLCGSGPGHLVYLISLFVAFFEERSSLESSLIRQFTLQTFLGTALWGQARSSDSFEELIKEVSSRGGVTEKMISSLREAKIEECYAQTFKLALERINSLKKDSFFS